MPRKSPINSLFLVSEDEFEKAHPIVFGSPSVYNNKVMVHDWQLRALAEPRDNMVLTTSKGNLHNSSYRRLGSELIPTGISQTREAMEQINLHDNRPTIYQNRSLLNMFSYSLTESVGGKDSLKLAGFELYPLDHGLKMDYSTTTGRDYQYFKTATSAPRPLENKSHSFNRHTIAYNDKELSERHGARTFFDDDMELHDNIAALKMDRYRSYDPILKVFTDPCKFASYKLNGRQSGN